MRLAGKIALVTGSARGIGRGIALRFAREGAQVGIVDLDEAQCQGVSDEITTSGGEAVALAGDISNETDVDRIVETIRQRFGAPNVLVNNAAVMPSGALHQTSLADFDRCLSVNLRGTFLISSALIPDMLAAGKGSIIHMASSADG